jgi:AraC family transcriptional regulator
VSRALGVHPAHVAREFRRHARASVGEYVRCLRIAWACEELARGGMPLARVAIEAGFFDQAHFCRAFRRECGAPPSRFRRFVRAAHRVPLTH